MGERVHILLGGVPFPAECIAELDQGVEVIRLLEDVGHRGATATDEDTAFFGRWMIFKAHCDGERHITTGRRVFRLLQARAA